MPIAERQDECTSGEALLRRARGGAGGLLLVEGQAGIGKTTLLDAIVAAAEGFTVLRATGDERERGFAFGVARQLFERKLAADAMLRERVLTGAARLAASVILPDADASAAPVSAPAAQHALTWLTANLADDRPLLLVTDDLQWADPASLGWQLHLARRLADLPVAVVAAWRTGEPGSDEDALDRLRSERAVSIVRPAPLSAAGVADVVGGALGDRADEALCEACARASGGNPFLLHELLRALADLPTAGPAAVDAVRPESVARSVGRRLGRLPPPAQRAAAACAVLGDGCELRHVQALAGLDRGEAVASVDALAAASILATGRPLRFVHPLVRRAVYDRLAEQARAQAHADAARILAAEGADVLRLAVHLVAAPPSADPAACAVLRRAGASALARGAPAEAAVLLERALSEPAPEAERPAILLDLGVAELRLNRATGEDRLRSVARESPSARERALALIELSTYRPFSSQPSDLDALRRASADLGDEDRELALVLDANAVISGRLLDHDAGPSAAAVAGVGETLAATTPGERLLLAAHVYHDVISGGRSAEAFADQSERALATGALAREWPESLAPLMTVMWLLVADRVQAARVAIDAGLAAAGDSGSELAFALWSLADCYRGWLQGELVEAEAAGASAMAVTGPVGPGAIGAVGYHALVLVERGALADAETVLTRALGPVGQRAEPSLMESIARRAAARLRFAQSRWEDAATEALAAGRGLAQQGADAHPGYPWRLDAAVAHAALGDRDAARTLVAEQWPIARRWDTPRMTGLVLHAEGLVEGGERGIELLTRAADTLATTPARLEHARSLLELGAMMRRHGRRAEARDVLRRALDLADRCGAGQLTARAREEIAASGGRPRRERLSGVEALTPSELRVARMAAQGMGNRDIAQALFVTRKTVETQLGAAYRKLDISSRTALGPALDGEGGAGGG